MCTFLGFDSVIYTHTTRRENETEMTTERSSALFLAFLRGASLLSPVLMKSSKLLQI